MASRREIACPKPRRLQIWSSRKEINNYQTETSESKAGSELLDIILSKGNCGEDYVNQIDSSPPYFIGSPPSRASNPLIQDSEFGNQTFMSHFSPPLSPSACTGGSCFLTKIGNKPAPVRIEGFDCLSGDRRNCSIFAVA